MLEFQNFLMYIKGSELTVIGRAKIAKKKKKKRESFGASSEGFEVLPVCPPVC